MDNIETHLPLPDTAIEAITVAKRLAALRNEYNEAIQQFITADARCLAIISEVGAISSLSDPVLIIGNSGTGKEILARALHWKFHKPFIAINCAALPDTLYISQLFGHVRGAFTGATDDKDGVFVAAGEGTVFLDEIGDMPLHQQAALLRVLQERVVTPIGSHTNVPINCRIIAATNKDITLPDSNFRDDLLGRLSTFELHIPPYCERPQDVELIATHLGMPGHLATTIYNTHTDFINRFGARGIQTLARRQQVLQFIQS